MTAISRTIRTQFGISTDFPGSTGSSWYAIESAHHVRKKITIAPNQNTILPMIGLTDPPLNIRGHGQNAIQPAIVHMIVRINAQKIFFENVHARRMTGIIMPAMMNMSPQRLSTQNGMVFLTWFLSRHLEWNEGSRVPETWILHSVQNDGT